ncbi:MAG: AzlD domain-containing protein [Clostridia bacterium]|nr:AzlD domain-containing protein [Clostridia bacterium]
MSKTDNTRFLIFALVTAATTYLIRLLPMLLINREITNRFVLSFLHYIPYATLSAMTVPAIFYATSSPVTAAAGFVAAFIMSFFNRSLISVASVACLAVFAAEIIVKQII